MEQARSSDSEFEGTEEAHPRVALGVGKRAYRDRDTMTATLKLDDRPPSGLRLLLTVFLPFAAGYFLSYLFRTVNGIISSDLSNEFQFDAATLGVITSVYFLTFAVCQVPLGVAIDQFGPRRVQSWLLVLAATGAAIFALAHGLVSLIFGRALIGLGVSASLMAGLKALVLWVPKQRLPLFNGLFIMCGGLGAVAATEPIEVALQFIDWRMVFLVLGGLTLIAGALVHGAVPDKIDRRPPVAWTDVAGGVAATFRDPVFWRLAPSSAMTIATAWSVQGLWAARWFVDVDGLGPQTVAFHLLIMSMGLTIGAVSIGVAAHWLKRHGVSYVVIFAAASGLFMLIQLGLILRVPLPGDLLWGSFAVFGGMTVLSYSMVAEHFPEEVIGRTNGALNLLHIGSAFAVQYAMGVVIALWQPDPVGHYPQMAYQAAFALPLVLQIAAFAWFIRPAWKTPQPIRAGGFDKKARPRSDAPISMGQRRSLAKGRQVAVPALTKERCSVLNDPSPLRPLSFVYFYFVQFFID